MPPERSACLPLVWRGFLRLLIGVLAAALLVSLFLALFPGALVPLLELLPGNVAIPALGEVPPEPQIDAARGELPGGYAAYTGVVAKMPTACNFLLELEGGQRVGVGTAHALAALPADSSVVFRAADGTTSARMGGRIGLGREFLGEQLDMDYALWEVRTASEAASFLRPDPRGQAQPGERVILFSRSDDGTGASLRRAGVAMAAKPNVTWVKMEETFNPDGYSGCPVVSRHTGRVVGMAVAGSHTSPVILGLHPVGSLVEKALAALAGE